MTTSLVLKCRSQALLGLIYTSLLLLLCLSAQAFAQDDDHVDLSNESLGKVQLGDRLTEVMRVVGRPDESSKQFEDAQNNCTKQLHFYNNGLEVEMCKTKSSERVHTLRVVKNSQIKTSRGISTGATSEQVMTMYPKHERKAKHSIIVLDRRTHLRLRFLLDNDRVYEISLYRNKPKQRSIYPRAKRRRSLFD